jgi:hypothetical protein
MINVATIMGEDIDLGTGSTYKPFQGGGTLPGHQVSLSTLSLVGAAGVATTQSWDPGQVASGGSVSTTVTIPGADPDQHDKVMASFTSLLTNDLIMFQKVSAVNTVTITLYNFSGALITQQPGTLSVLVFRHR